MCNPCDDIKEKEEQQPTPPAAAAEPTKPLLSVKNLNFSYEPSKHKDLVNLNCIVKPKSKVILVGANGAGKSTLIRVLTGLIWTADVEYDELDIHGRATSNDQVNGVAYLGERWKRRRTGFEGVCPYTLDTTPKEMFVKWQQQHHERRDELVKVLGVNMDWRLNECSDGQRKKVRLLFKLLKPFQLAIMDEFVADLDIFSRQRFLDYLSKECEERGASVVFATHIFDQVDVWATHVAFLQLDGTLSQVHELHTLPEYQEILARTGEQRAMCPMYTLILEEMERQYHKEQFYLDDDETDEILKLPQQTILNRPAAKGEEDVVVVAMEEEDVDVTTTTADPKTPPPPPILVKNLNFSYITGKPTISNLNLTIPPNSKVLLVGANGTGKSTLIRMLTGQIWTGMDYDEFQIAGNEKPNDQHGGVTYLGSAWKRQQTAFEGMCPYTVDCAARDMFAKWQEEHSERRDELVKVLGIDLNWRMNECSDGQRKKIRIMIKLLKPFQVCVIDEFAADLDILSRSHFFAYLSKECEQRGASVIYATHIFDQADAWASHICFMRLDRVLTPLLPLQSYRPYQDVVARSGRNRAMCPMYVLVMEELQRQYRASGIFVEDFDNNNNNSSDNTNMLVDAIMQEQSQELGADRFETNAMKDQENWTSGRLTKQLCRNEQEDARQERRRKREEAEVGQQEGQAL